MTKIRDATAEDLPALTEIYNHYIQHSHATFLTEDPDAADVHSYALVAGAGDSGNASFSIVGDALRTAVEMPEGGGNLSIRVRSTDAASSAISGFSKITSLSGWRPIRMCRMSTSTIMR